MLQAAGPWTSTLSAILLCAVIWPKWTRLKKVNFHRFTAQPTQHFSFFRKWHPLSSHRLVNSSFIHSQSLSISLFTSASATDWPSAHMWNPRTRILLTRNFVGPQWVLLSSKLLSFTFEQCTFLWCCSLCRKRWPRRLSQSVESFSVTIQMKATALYFPVMVELNLVTLSFKPTWQIVKCEDSNESDWMLLTVFCGHQPFLHCALMQSFFLSTSWKFGMSTCCKKNNSEKQQNYELSITVIIVRRLPAVSLVLPHANFLITCSHDSGWPHVVGNTR